MVKRIFDRTVVPGPPARDHRRGADSFPGMGTRLPPGAPDSRPAGRALLRCAPGMPFEWALHPWTGCEFPCPDCLEPDDPGKDRDGASAETGHRRSREDLPRLLGRDLEGRVFPGHRIAAGTTADPYPPEERGREVTRHCLRVLARSTGLRLSITTRSDLVLRDLDLLRVVAAGNALHVNVVLPTLDRAIAADLEPGFPAPGRRLQALRTLSAEGMETGVVVRPVLPGLTDGPGMLEDLAAAAAGSGATYLVHRCASLQGPGREAWFRHLRARWPALLRAHASWPGDGSRPPEGYRAALARRMARARRRYRLADGPSDRSPADPQLTLRFLS